jgi:nitronate monooxygenase
MLESERAGAKALVVYLDSYSRNSEGWNLLRRVQADEAHNCGLIGEQLKKRGKDYSHATGEFYDKAVASEEPRARIGFLIRGLKWAVREFEGALPRIPDAGTRKLFEGMRERHLRSIGACETLLRSLPE